MQIASVHRRRLAAPPEAVGDLLDRLASPDDRLWPCEAWPAMRFDRPLGPGAAGGHGPIRYTVEEHRPGAAVVFRFTGPPGLSGSHRFEVSPDGDGALLTHVIEGAASLRFTPVWTVVYRPLHDALLEDALDRAEAACSGSVASPARWSWWVRVLRRALSRGR